MLINTVEGNCVWPWESAAAVGIITRPKQIGRTKTG
jgi:hypothetical protein